VEPLRVEFSVRIPGYGTKESLELKKKFLLFLTEIFGPELRILHQKLSFQEGPQSKQTFSEFRAVLVCPRQEPRDHLGSTPRGEKSDEKEV
jgi:hypothetical protein